MPRFRLRARGLTIPLAALSILISASAQTAGPAWDAGSTLAADASGAGDNSGTNSAVVRANPADFAGAQACKTCHPSEFKVFYRNPHFKSIASGKEPPDVTGCEGCHGPAKAHIEAKGGRTTIPRAFSLMSSAKIIETCLNCHTNEFNRANIRRSEHTEHDVACTACHSNHHSTTPRFLLAKSQPEACYQCHADVRSQFNMPSKHRVNEGFMACSDCHNPHGGFTPTFAMGKTSKMLVQSHGNDQPCLNCHVDKRGPFIFEHQAGNIDGCISCHRPHGSTNAKMLIRASVATLCIECHTGTGDFGSRMGRGITVPDAATHSMVDPHYQNCTGCHVKIHGSNVHYRFLR